MWPLPRDGGWLGNGIETQWLYIALYRTFHTTQTGTWIPTPYFCTGQESESIPVSECSNMFKPLLFHFTGFKEIRYIWLPRTSFYSTNCICSGIFYHTMIRFGWCHCVIWSFSRKFWLMACSFFKAILLAILMGSLMKKILTTCRTVQHFVIFSQYFYCK